jgi:methionyl-tRNA formyltransferase
MVLMRVVYFGSGAFGLPTLTHLATQHDIALLVSQPDRPAGRKRQLTPTPIAEFAASRNLRIAKPEKINDAAVVDQIRAVGADAWVVIAFGQKLGRRLLEDRFAINLHGSLLPRYRGAAPINWAMINGERETGVSVIALADRMDAGEIYAAAATTIDPSETAGELHDRLAGFGPELIDDVLQRHDRGTLIGQAQDERLATHAPKLTKADGTVRFDQPASAVRNRIHGLTPWPGCTVRLDGRDLRLHRAHVTSAAEAGAPGEVLADHLIACAPGTIELLEVQPPGRDAMSFAAYRNGHAVRVGSRMEHLA